MRRLALFSIIILLAACSTAPSEGAVGTAIPQTEAAKSSNTPIPSNTTEPTATNTIEPTPTETPTPSATSTPTITASPTPIPYIVLTRCDCTENVPQGEFVIVRLRWGANTKELAEEGADNVRYTLTINEEEVENIDQYRKPAVYEEAPFVNGELWWVYWDYPLGFVEQGRYIAQSRFLAEENINDGMGTTPKGYASIKRAIINVTE